MAEAKFSYLYVGTSYSLVFEDEFYQSSVCVVQHSCMWTLFNENNYKHYSFSKSIKPMFMNRLSFPTLIHLRMPISSSLCK